MPICANASREHDHRYHVLDAPVISDREYDALFAQLKQLEREHPELVHAGSPTQRVGESPRASAVKAEHAQPMYSLDNTYNEDALREFDRRVREGLDGDAFAYVVEPKIDGASLEVIYKDGKLALGITRGDGRVGEDVTINVRTMRSVPLTLRDTRAFTLRGEVVLFRKDLDAINERRIAEGEEPFANPRNAAAGAMRMLDPQLDRGTAAARVLLRAGRALLPDAPRSARRARRRSACPRTSATACAKTSTTCSRTSPSSIASAGNCRTTPTAWW